LLCDEGGDVGLEATGAETHDDDGDDKTAEGTVGMVDDSGNGGNNEEDMADEGYGGRDTDGLEATPSCVGHVGAK
jgi:hypothetical protein